jgi:uncharacterized hydrophobic protein (TIGR00271 family)
MGLLSNIVKDNKFTPEDVPPFEDKLFFEGDKRRVNLERFAVLLFLSTVIAAYGVIADSTATVIGAMIIAPLMIPIMATAAGLVMGDMERAGRSLLVVILGVAGTIGVAWFIGFFLSTSVISYSTNTQITGRISPSLTDLMIALACGAAGAFAMSRSDVADSLPGVAISISLVPPLCVVGLGLAGAEWNVAWGAMLLFLTNFLSILLAGGGTLALLGLSAASTKQLQKDKRRRAFIFVIIGVLIVAIPLAATSIQVAQETIAQYQTKTLMKQWLSQSNLELNRINVNGNQIEVIISGDGDTPPLSDLTTSLQSTLDPQIQLELKVVPSKIIVYPEPVTE